MVKQNDKYNYLTPAERKKLFEEQGLSAPDEELRRQHLIREAEDVNKLRKKEIEQEEADNQANILENSRVLEALDKKQRHAERIREKRKIFEKLRKQIGE